METGLSVNNIKYLEARCQKLHNREKICSLIFDEIYSSKHCEFFRSNGQICGMSNEQPTKTLLSVMFNSIASRYEDVEAIILLTKIDCSILHKLLNDFRMHLPLWVMMSWFFWLIITPQMSRFIKYSIYPLHLYPTRWTSIDFYTPSVINAYLQIHL